MMGGMAALAIAMPLVAKHVNPKYFPDKHRRAGQLRNPQEVARTLWNKVLKPLIRVFATPLKLLPLPKVKSFLIRGMVKVTQFFKKMGVGLFRCKAFKVPSGFLPRIGYAGSWAIVLLLMTLEKRLFGKLGFLAKPFQWILDWGIFKDKRAHAEEAFQEVVGKPLQNIVERLPGLNH
jgi:hypothetical protein